MPASTQSQGTLDLLRSLLRAGVELYKSRLQLALVELQEEKERLRQTAVLVALALLLGLFGCAVLTALICYGLALAVGLGAALGIVTVTYLGVAAVLFAVARAKQRSHPSPWHETRKEFEKDRNRLRDLVGRQSNGEAPETLSFE